MVCNVYGLCGKTKLIYLRFVIWLQVEWKVLGGEEGTGETDRKFLANVIIIVFIISPTLVPPKPVKPILYKVSLRAGDAKSPVFILEVFFYY